MADLYSRVSGRTTKPAIATAHAWEIERDIKECNRAIDGFKQNIEQDYEIAWSKRGLKKWEKKLTELTAE